MIEKEKSPRRSTANTMIRTLLFIAFILVHANPASAQDYTLVIKGGHVIDPKNNINGIMDVAITGGKVTLVAPNIDAGKAPVIDAK